MNVIGFGGVFWRSSNITELKKWYKEVLGIPLDNEWNGTIFSLFKEDSDYFPMEQQVMLNFQVEDMNECVKHLQKLGISLLKEPEKSDFGTFTWIADPEGRRIELWEK